MPGLPLGSTGAQVLLVLYQEVAATGAPPGHHRGTTGRPADLIGPCSSYLDVLLGAGVLRGHGDDGCGSAVGMSALFLLAHLVRSQPAGVLAPSAIELPHMWTLLQGLLGGGGFKS